MGTPPLMGRVPTREEDVLGGPAVVVLSHGLWSGCFGSDPSILSGQSFEIIGVMPAGFDFPSPEIDLRITRRLDPESENFGGNSMGRVANARPPWSASFRRSSSGSSSWRKVVDFRETSSASTPGTSCSA